MKIPCPGCAGTGYQLARHVALGHGHEHLVGCERGCYDGHAVCSYCEDERAVMYLNGKPACEDCGMEDSGREGTATVTNRTEVIRKREHHEGSPPLPPAA